MVEDCPNPDRSWREIAEEVSTEHNSGKIVELGQELFKALDKDAQQSKMAKRDEVQVRRKSA